MPATSVEIRQARRDDAFILEELDACIGIGEPFNPSPLPHWSVAAFERAWEMPRMSMMVAKQYKKIVGYLLTYKSSPSMLNIERIVIDPFYQRRKIGTELICDMIQEAYVSDAVRTIRCCVPERYVDFQFFLRANGFKATRVVRSENEVGDDHFMFELKIPRCNGA